MTITRAAKYMKQGMSVRRRIWADYRTIIRSGQNGLVEGIDGYGQPFEYIVMVDDIVSKDWVLVPRKQKGKEK